MVVCPYCGKENNQPDAAYCLYCGSSLQQAQSTASPTFSSGTSRGPVIGQGYGMPGGMSSSSSTTLSSEPADRYQKALRRVEQLGYVVVALAVITLVLLLSIAF
jgi:hypothetical protein